MAATRLMSVIVARTFRLLEINKQSLGLQFISYGLLETIPKVPAAVIEPARYTADLAGTSLRVDNTFEVATFIYHSGTAGEKLVQEAADSVTEELVAIYNLDAAPVASGGTNWDDTLLHGHVTSVDYGYLPMVDRRMRANRIIFTGISRTGLIS